MLTRSQRLALNALTFIAQVVLAAFLLWCLLVFWLSWPLDAQEPPGAATKAAMVEVRSSVRLIDAPRPKPERQRIVDRKFLAVMGVLAAAKSADFITTTGTGPGCYEGDAILFGRHPSDQRVALTGAAYLAGEVAVAYGIKRLGRGHRWARGLWAVEPLMQAGQHGYYAKRNTELRCR